MLEFLETRRESHHEFNSTSERRFLAHGWFSDEGLPHVAHGSRADTGIGSCVRRVRGSIKGNGLSSEFLDPVGTVRHVGPHAAAMIPLKMSQKVQNTNGSERVSL